MRKFKLRVTCRATRPAPSRRSPLAVSQPDAHAPCLRAGRNLDMLLTFALPIVLLLGAGCAAQPSDAPAPQPTNQPTNESARADGKLSADSSLDQILDALDRRGEDLRSLASDVTLTETDAALGDDVRRSGSFALELRPDGSARSRVTFNDKVANNRRTQEKIEYLLDGPNLIDRTYRTKTQVTRQVLRPGERLNLLKLG